MKVLISGSRKWVEQASIEAVLKTLPPGTVVVHGACKGVDNIAADVARRLGFTVRDYPAEANGRKWPEAGPLRNSEMLLKEHPSPDGQYIDKALIFHRDPNLGTGTRDMHGKIKKAEPVIPIEVYRK